LAEQAEVEFSECQIWFTVRSKDLIQTDGRFYIVLSPEQAIEFLKQHLKKNSHFEEDNEKD